MQNSLNKRLAAYGTMSLAMAAVTIPSAASAGVIEFTVANPTTPSTGGSVFFDVMTGQIDLSFEAGDYELRTEEDTLGRTVARFVAQTNEFAVFPSSGSVARYAIGVAVGPALSFKQAFSTLASNYGMTPPGHWNPASPGQVTDGYVALKLVQGGLNDYGWAHISVNGDYTVTLKAFGYDNGGAPIQTGAGEVSDTPEPSSMALLALGAAGIGAFRRKKSL